MRRRLRSGPRPPRQPRRRKGIFREPAQGAAQEIASPWLEAAGWALLRLLWWPFKVFFKTLGKLLEAAF